MKNAPCGSQGESETLQQQMKLRHFVDASSEAVRHGLSGLRHLYVVAPVVFPSRRTQHHHSLVIHRQIRAQGGAPSPPRR
jgi:hypothetical protein